MIARTGHVGNVGRNRLDLVHELVSDLAIQLKGKMRHRLLEHWNEIVAPCI